MLFCITIFVASRMSDDGKPGGSSWQNVENQRWRVSMLWVVSMLVYIDTASLVPSLKEVGRVSFSSSDCKVSESRMYDGTKCLSTWSRKSIQVDMAARSEPLQLTTGRSFIGFLWIFTSP